MPRKMETENLTGVIKQWISNDAPKPSKFLLGIGEEGEVELTIWPDRASQVAIRDSLELIDPDDLVNQQVIVTVETPPSEYQGTVQYRVTKIRTENAPAQGQQKQPAPAPSVARSAPAQVEPASYAPASRQEIGMATGNAKNGGFAIVSAYYQKQGDLPSDELLIAFAERVNFFASALMNPPAPAPEAEEVDLFDSLGVISLDGEDE